MQFKYNPFIRKIKSLVFYNQYKHNLFSDLREKYYYFFWENAAEKIGATVEDLGNNYLRIKKDGLHTFVWDYEVEIDNPVILKIAGNKDLAYKLMTEKKYPIPQYFKFNLDTLENAKKFIKNSNGNFVVKPTGGGGGRGVTMGINSEESLEKAAHHAAIFGSQFLIEQEISGHSYRLLYLNGKFIDAIRRDPPKITGDGKSTIKQLIEQTNNNRLNSKPFTALSPLVIDDDLLMTLKKNNLKLKDVPGAKEEIVVKSVINQNSAGENHIVRDETHADIIKLGAEIVKYFGIELGGIDVISKNISEPLEKAGGVINEINTTPGLHHHDLVAETENKIHVGAKVLQYIFDKKSQQFS